MLRGQNIGLRIRNRRRVVAYVWREARRVKLVARHFILSDRKIADDIVRCLASKASIVGPTLAKRQINYTLDLVCFNTETGIKEIAQSEQRKI